MARSQKRGVTSGGIEVPPEAFTLTMAMVSGSEMPLDERCAALFGGIAVCAPNVERMASAFTRMFEGDVFAEGGDPSVLVCPDIRDRFLLPLVRSARTESEILAICKAVHPLFSERTASLCREVFCTPAARDDCFLPLVTRSLTMPRARLAAVGLLSFVASLHIVLFAAVVKDKIVRPYSQLAEDGTDVAALCNLVAALTLPGEGAAEARRLFTVKWMRSDFFLRFVESETVPSLARALRSVAGNHDEAARRLFAIPTFRDEFFLSLVPSATYDAAVGELTQAMCTIAMMDDRLFATITMRDQFFLRIVRHAGPLSVRPLADALRCMALDRRAVFATQSMCDSFFLPLANIANVAKSTESAEALLTAFVYCYSSLSADQFEDAEITCDWFVHTIAEHATTMRAVALLAQVVAFDDSG